MCIAYYWGVPYLPRYLIVCDDSYFHVTWQCHNKDWLLRWDWAKRIYYDLLLKYKDKYGLTFHSYNLMDSHPHLIGHMKSKEKFSAFFQVVNGLFAKAVNKRLKRRGQVVMDRFKSPMIQSDEHMLRAMAYSDLNDHRAGKVKHPRESRWSSYVFYAHGIDDPLITPAPSYLALGSNPKERQAEYRATVAALMDHRERMNISHTPYIGDPDWVIMKYRELCDALGRKVQGSRVSQLLGPPG